jgi:integrase
MGKAKKAALKSLPPHWREALFAQASQPEYVKARPQLLRALAVLWLTGCRPAELEQGVRIMRQRGTIAIEVKGVKCVDADDRERGQPLRYYGFRADLGASVSSPALILLNSLADENEAKGVQEFSIAHNADYLYNSVVSLAKAVFPKMRTRVSPYCFRHQLASDLKSDPEVTLEDAAKFMGHLSDYSIGKYGHASHGRRGRGVQGVVKTSRQIKHSTKVDRLARFKIASAKKRKFSQNL